MLPLIHARRCVFVEEDRVVERRSVTTAADPRTSNMTTEGSVVEESIHRSPSGAEVARRIVVFLFAIVQGLIGLRIILLLADANQGNAIVKSIIDASGIFVAPFEGILNTNAVQAGASVLDVAALVALAGYTILELLIVAAVGIGRSER
jgi:hypothetical protein